jgi:hypothetical protein
MGDAFVGIVHPSKIYNILSVGAPALYIGPQPSHISELALPLIHKHHGDVHGVSEAIVQASRRPVRTVYQTGIFKKEMLLPQLLSAIEGDSVENLFRPLPDSDDRFVDYHAAGATTVPALQATRHPN